MNDHPDDLKIKIGSPEQKAWTDIKERVVQDNAQMRRSLILNEEILKKCDEMIEKEKL